MEGHNADEYSRFFPNKKFKVFFLVFFYKFVRLAVPIGVGWNHRVCRALSFLSSRRNWNSPTPSPAGECVSPPLLWGRGYTLVCGRGGWGGSPNSDEGTETVVPLGIYVLCGWNLYSIDLQALGAKIICCFLCLEHEAKRRDGGKTVHVV
jgi:hypothetical protein